MTLTIQKILDGDYNLQSISSEMDYDKIWTVLRMAIDDPDIDFQERRRLQFNMHALVEFNDNKTRLFCNRCGKAASWNTPVTDGAGIVLCETCAKEDTSDTVWYGIEQRRGWDHDMPVHMDPQRLEWLYRGVVLMATQNYHVERHPMGYVRHLMTDEARDRAEKAEILSHSGSPYGHPRFQFDLPQFVYSCWIRGGNQAIHLTKEEEAMEPHDLLRHIYLTFVRGDHYRCTMCNKDFPNPPAARPLFAGAVCEGCAKVHAAQLEKERKEGHVCRMCGQPYGNCSC